MPEPVTPSVVARTTEIMNVTKNLERVRARDELVDDISVIALSHSREIQAAVSAEA
jgi:hypothetical protein